MSTLEKAIGLLQEMPENKLEAVYMYIRFVNSQVDMNEEDFALNKSPLEERQRGFEGLMSFAGTLPEDFDYKKNWRRRGMKNMRVLFDTNIILDVLEKRLPFYDSSKLVLESCVSGGVTGYIALHSVSNIFYIFRKRYSSADRRKILLNILALLQVAGADHKSVLNADTPAIIPEDFLKIL